LDVFFDTSVLVASAFRHHPHHPRAINAMDEVASRKHRGFVAAHSLAETYAVLTRLPLRPVIHPSEAHRIIEESIIPHCEVVVLNARDYREVLSEASSAGFAGGLIYDALLLRCARKSNCDRIYTFNINHFRSVAPDLESKICAPA
jgi:predicted nucleic acid-binding protein